jgi:hypothetical protein
VLGRSRLIGLDERQQQLCRACFARRGAIDQLLDCRLELGNPAAAAVLVDRHALAERCGDDCAQIACTPRAASRVAGLAGAKARCQGWPTVADALFGCWRRIGVQLFVHALAYGVASPLAMARSRAADTVSNVSPVVANCAKPPV